MDTFLPPVEEPRALIMRLAYYFTRKQFGSAHAAQGPLGAVAARLRALLLKDRNAGQKAHAGARDGDAHSRASRAAQRLPVLYGHWRGRS